MPIYEYECRGCGHTLDVLQKVTDSPLRKCPECGALKLQRLVSAPQFRLKGGGWYETDFKQNGRRRVIDDGAGTDSAGGEKADKAEKTDAAAKPEKSDKSATSAGAQEPAAASKAGKKKGITASAPAKPPPSAAD
ncbi:MAG: zinc ribbon domain-containing protein [Gammaproteobacteria bacterium]|nr:zinc ribbon domain-containing protein [Gammaproteobacteria bacterium]